MNVRQLITEQMQREEVRRDLQQVLAQHGVREVRYLDPERELESRFEPVQLIVELEEGRSLLDVLSLEGDLEMLLQHRVSLLTRQGLAANKLNRIIEASVPLNG